jgi:hypothetical protein
MEEDDMNIITDPMALIASRSEANGTAFSALPWAPVVEERETRHLRRVRSGLAESLLTLAVKVQPLEPSATARTLSPGC